MTLLDMIRRRRTATAVPAIPAIPVPLGDAVVPLPQPRIAEVAGIAVAANAGAIPNVCAAADADRLMVSTWLDLIAEHDPAERARVLALLERDEATGALILDMVSAALAEAAAPGITAVLAAAGAQSDDPPSPMVRCNACTRLMPSGRCGGAARGLVQASQEWEPRTDIRQRCQAFLPLPYDPDQRDGRERWGDIP